MYDKTVRRRRAVLALLVVLSLILLTAYFGEASSGPLNTVQDGFLTVISPIEDGANKALKPVRDLFGWFGDTLHAKGRLKDALAEESRLRHEVVANQSNERSYHELLKLYDLDNELSVADYSPVTATVVYKSPNLWYSTVLIDKGTSSGVHVNDPVINNEGLIGKVTRAASDGALVSLITDSAVEVTAQINATGEEGIVQPEVGEPGRLLLQYLPSASPVSKGDYVVTSGKVSSQGDSLYPKGIPIGRVASINEQSPYKSVNVSPLADLHKLDVVQVLTSRAGSRAATDSELAKALAPARPTGGEEEEAQGAQVASAEGGG